MSGLSCMQHDPNILLASMRFFSRSFAHGPVKPIVNSTKWTQSAVKRKAFEHGTKSMVTESAIRVIEIARCLFSKQTKTAGPQRTTLPCLFIHIPNIPMMDGFIPSSSGIPHPNGHRQGAIAMLPTTATDTAPEPGYWQPPRDRHLKAAF